MSLYSEPPVLNPVEVREVTLRCDGPSWLVIRAELPVFPDKPPARWGREANAAQVTLDLWGVSDFEQQGWGMTNRGTLTLERLEDGKLLFSFNSESTRLSAKCELARISGVSAYVNGAAA